MTVTPELLASLATMLGRCAECGFHAEIQGHRATCPERHEGHKRAEVGMSRAEAANPSDVATVDRAIAAACATGEPFSANDFRHLCDQLDQPAVLGARIRAWVTSKRIKRVGDVPSTLPGTHGHRIGVYASP